MTRDEAPIPAVRGFRFHPPRVGVGKPIDWMLARAFGPVARDLSTLGSPEPPEVLEMCAAFGLLGRVRSRGDGDRLGAELGEEALGILDAEVRRRAVTSLVYRRRATELVGIAGTLDVRLIFLKGAALDLMGLTRPGSRPMGDIDVLTTEAEAWGLHSALLGAGYRETGQAAPRHHLPRLVHESGGVLEIHHRLRGLLGTDLEATAEDCLEAGRCEALTTQDGACFIPKTELMLAHLLAHALDQHAMTPEAYRTFLVVGDLQDLGALEAGSEPDWVAAMEWAGVSVSRRESAALRELGRNLAAGRLASEIAADEGDSAELLRHFLAGQLDDDYRRTLKVRREMRVPIGANRVEAHLESASRALLLSRAQIDAIYGPPRSRMGYLGRRVWRPFDLLGRLAASAWAALRLRARARKSGATRKGA